MKIQFIIFTVIVVIFGVLFYVTQAGYLGLNTPPKDQVSISQIPGEITLVPSQGQGQQMQQQQQQQVQVLDPKTLESYKRASATATIKTSKGDIVLELYGEDAPYTVANFIKKAEEGSYNNLTFHRVEGWVIQGGDPLGTGTGGGKMKTEINDKPFVTGSLGVARGMDLQVSNDAQFFITKEDSSHLNSQYTNFGMVKEGMDVVNQIAIGDKILSVTIE